MGSLRSRLSTNLIASPWGIWLLILAVISITEYAIMLVLPIFLYGESPRLLESTVDALMLSVVLSPVLWRSIVRPLRRAAEQRERFLSDLFATIEEERRRMAHELHDGVGQYLTLVVSGLRSLPEQADLEDLHRRSRDLTGIADRALADVKQLALGLRPSLLDDLGLAPAIERIAEDVATHNALAITVNDQTAQGVRFPEKVETALFRICQEALNNVVKHAGARRVAVHLTRTSESLVLEIADDGCGIDPAVLHRKTAKGGHLGLVGMHERAALLGGELDVRSRVGQGTRITARIPLPADSQ